MKSTHDFNAIVYDIVVDHIAAFDNATKSRCKVLVPPTNAGKVGIATASLSDRTNHSVCRFDIVFADMNPNLQKVSVRLACSLGISHEIVLPRSPAAFRAG